MTSNGEVFLAVGSDGTAKNGLIASMIRSGVSAYLSLTDGTTTVDSAPFAFTDGQKYRVKMNITPDKNVAAFITEVIKGDLPDGHDTVTDTERARASLATTDGAFLGSALLIGTSDATANFDIVKVNNPGMLMTRYRSYSTGGGTSYSVPDDRIQTEAFCLSCHGSSYDAPGGNQQQYYTSTHNPMIGGMNDQAMDQENSIYQKADPSQLTPRWQEIRDAWKDLKTNPVYVLPSGGTIGSLLKNTSNACFYCHGYHGLQFYSRTQSGEEELCYTCHGKVANKSRDNWNIYQQYNGYVQNKSTYLRYSGTWTQETGTTYSGGSVTYATGTSFSPAWWNGAWNKRKKVTIANTGGAVTDYQMNLTIAYDSDMKQDYSDLRFTASDGVTPINHWIQSTSGSSANVWVKIPTLAGTPASTDVYMYYSNAAAVSASNMAGTFVFADDFLTSQLAANWTKSGNVYVNSGWVILDRTSVSSTLQTDFPSVATGDFAVEAKLRLDNVYRNRSNLIKADNSGSAPGDHGIFYYSATYPRSFYWNGWDLTPQLTPSPTDYVMQYYLTSPTFGYYWRFYNYANGAMGSLVDQKSSTTNGPASAYVRWKATGDESDNSDWRFDWVRVRKVATGTQTPSYAAEVDGNPRVTFGFSGTSVLWESTKGPDRGTASVYIDGAFVTDVNLMNGTTQYMQTVYSNTGLATGAHSIAIVPTSGRVDIDAMQGSGVGSMHGLTLKETTIKCTSCHGQRGITDRHVYEGFSTSTIANPANIKQYWSDQRSKNNKTINDYCNVCHTAADTKGRVLRETHTADKIIPYTIKYPPIITTSSANGFDRTGYTLGDEYTNQENFPSVTKVGTWITETGDDYEGGELIYSVTGLDYVEFSFIGTYVSWISRVGPDMGIAQVFIDGVRYKDGGVALDRTQVLGGDVNMSGSAYALANSVLKLNSILAAGTICTTETDKTAIGGTSWSGNTLTEARQITNDVTLAGSITIASGSTLLTGSSLRAASTCTSETDKNAFGGTWTGTGPYSLTGDMPNEFSGVDLYSPVAIPKQKVAEKSNLSLGTHTIRVVVRGDHGLGSSNRVDLDAFRFNVPRVGHYLYLAPAAQTTIVSKIDSTHIVVQNGVAGNLAKGAQLTIDPAGPHSQQTVSIVNLGGINNTEVEVSPALNGSHTVGCVVQSNNCAGSCHTGLPDYIQNSQEARSKITCVTCHHPHATEFKRVVRWAPDAKEGTTVKKGGCLHCHDGSVPY